MQEHRKCEKKSRLRCWTAEGAGDETCTDDDGRKEGEKGSRRSWTSEQSGCDLTVDRQGKMVDFGGSQSPMPSTAGAWQPPSTVDLNAGNLAFGNPDEARSTRKGACGC